MLYWHFHELAKEGGVMIDQIMLDTINKRGAKFQMIIEYDHDYLDWYVIRTPNGLKYTSQFPDFESAFNYFMDTLIDFELSRR